MNLHWTKLAERHPDEKQCLASFIAWQAAEVIAKAKPANLINVFNKTLPCNRNMHHLWERHSLNVLEKAEINAIELKQKNGQRLVLVYHPEMLGKVVQQSVVKKTLNGLGYKYNNLDEAISHLKIRMSEDIFPHEIGFFLGYPIKDVLAFMGLIELPLVANGPWKMYGKLEKSHSTLNAHLSARQTILQSLDSKLPPLQIIQKRRPAFSLAA